MVDVMLSSAQVAAFYRIQVKDLNTAVRASRAPPPDKGGQGKRNYWRLETVQANPYIPPGPPGFQAGSNTPTKRAAPHGAPGYPAAARANSRPGHFFGG